MNPKAAEPVTFDTPSFTAVTPGTALVPSAGTDFDPDCGRSFFLSEFDKPVPHRDDAIGIGRDVGLVCHQNDREAAAAVERDERVHDLVRRPRVEVSGRLVGEKDGRRIDQRARNGDALLLSAGKLSRCVVLALRQSDDTQRFACALGTLRAGRRRRRIDQRQFDILDGAGPSKQIVALKDKAEFSAADAGQCGLRQSGDVDALEQILAARRLVETAQDRHERRLARTRRSHDRNEFAARDRQIHAAKRQNVDIADVIGSGQTTDFNDGSCRRGAHGIRMAGAAALLFVLVAARSETITRSPSFTSPLVISVKLSSSSPVPTTTRTGRPLRKVQS